jgi:hypothetical protein
MLLAEEILSSALVRPELKQLRTAPDIVFAILCYAAAFLLMCKTTILRDFGTHLPGSSDALLTQIIDRLLQVACGPDHAPAKCARLISTLMRTYKVEATVNGEPSQHSPPNNPGEQPNLAISNVVPSDLDRLVNTDGTPDWASLIDTLS